MRFERMKESAWVLVAIMVVAASLAGCRNLEGRKEDSMEQSPKRADKVVKTDAEWKAQLTPEQYRILRNQGTEAAFCSQMNDVKEAGSFYCVGCGLELFKTDAKFTSGTGWPSFFQPVSDDAIWTRADNSYGMSRMEVLCSRCDGHLGHVFEDGPKPTGLRFCINGEVLKFVPRKAE